MEWPLRDACFPGSEVSVENKETMVHILIASCAGGTWYDGL